MTGIPAQFRLPQGVSAADEPVSSREQLVSFLAAGIKSDDGRVLGVEYERIPLRADGSAAPYADDGSSVHELLRFLIEHEGHRPIEMDGQLMGAEDADGTVNLEPGAQIELSLHPVRRAEEVHERLQRWRERLRRAADATGVFAAAIGLQPVTAIADLAWVPKERYRIMSRHLGTRGRLAHHMMKGTAGMQFNVDFTSEADAEEILQASLAVSPIVNAACANSPLEGGRANGALTLRPRIWNDTDPDRCGLLPWVFEEGFSFERYVDWALAVPVMFLVREGVFHALGDRTFGELLARSHPDWGAVTFDDFNLHLTTLFPEVRVKQHVEVRGADACSTEVVTAVAATWRGVLYDDDARAAARDLLADLGADARLRLHLEAGDRGLVATTPRGSLGDLLPTLIDIAEGGLNRLARDAGEESDATWLEPLRTIAAARRPPAHGLLEDWRARGSAALLERL